jgi:hypothetical protein
MSRKAPLISSSASLVPPVHNVPTDIVFMRMSKRHGCEMLSPCLLSGMLQTPRLRHTSAHVDSLDFVHEQKSAHRQKANQLRLELELELGPAPASAAACRVMLITLCHFSSIDRALLVCVKIWRDLEQAKALAASGRWEQRPRSE